MCIFKTLNWASQNPLIIRHFTNKNLTFHERGFVPTSQDLGAFAELTRPGNASHGAAADSPSDVTVQGKSGFVTSLLCGLETRDQVKRLMQWWGLDQSTESTADCNNVQNKYRPIGRQLMTAVAQLLQNPRYHHVVSDSTTSISCSGVAGPLAAQGDGQICRPFVLGFWNWRALQYANVSRNVNSNISILRKSWR